MNGKGKMGVGQYSIDVANHALFVMKSIVKQKCSLPVTSIDW
jgi:hypothetical protein